MNLLVAISGNNDKLLKVIGIPDNECRIAKLDEKKLSSPKEVLSLLKSGNSKNVFFGCLDLEFQRFQTFIKLYIFLSGILSGAIVDESGRMNRFSLLRLIVIELPMLCAEILASIVIVIIYDIRLNILFRRWTKSR